MKNKKIAITAVLLIVSIGNYFVIIANNQVRLVEFLSILAIGALLGILLAQLLGNFKGKDPKN